MKALDHTIVTLDRQGYLQGRGLDCASFPGGFGGNDGDRMAERDSQA